MPRDPAAPDPLLDQPAWAPSWLPTVDDARGLRALRWFAAAVFFVGLAACVSRGADAPADPVLAPEPGVSAPPGGDGSTTTSSTAVRSAAGLAATFGTVTAELISAAGEIVELCLLHADTAEERARGLMGVTDLEGHDGMAFTREEPTEGAFYMYRTVLPLTIAWWDGTGAFVSASDMAPCPSDDPSTCPRYHPAGPYETALEVEQRSPLVEAFTPGASLRLTGGSCPAPA